MAQIIIPGRQTFSAKEQNELDAIVDKITRDFDTSFETRRVFSDVAGLDEVPENWLQIIVPAYHGKGTSALIRYIRDVKSAVELRNESPIINPFDEGQARCRMLAEDWLFSPEVREQVRVYEEALCKAYFEFCKQATGWMLQRLSTFKDPPKSCKELHLIARRFDEPTYIQVNRRYYGVATHKFKVAREKAAPLTESVIGSCFVLSVEEERKLMEYY